MVSGLRQRSQHQVQRSNIDRARRVAGQLKGRLASVQLLGLVYFSTLCKARWYTMEKAHAVEFCNR